jgi:predicted protein tyrosine phosphatase
VRVDVYSRAQAEALTPEVNQVIISITVPGKPAAIRMVNEWAGILRLEFHDFATHVGATLTGEPDGDPIVYFDEAMAERVSAFVEEHARNGRDFVVHCDAGVSRSVAVGLYLRDVYGAELTTHAIHTTAAANSLVLRTLMRKHWEVRFKS